MSQKLEKIFLNIIKFGTVMILLLPFFVYRQVLYPYIFSKIIVFQIIVEIIFVLWLFLILYSKTKEKYRINWKNPLVIGITAFFGILVLTMLTGVDIRKSWWSSQERMTGILTLLHFYAWFLILISCFKRKKDYFLLLWSSLGCSLLVGLYGLGQKIGLEFLLSDSAQRMSSTLGNPDFLGIYSLINFFLALFILGQSKRKTVKVIALFFSLFNVFVLLATATRAAILGLVIAFLGFLLFLIFSRSGKKRIRFLAILFLLILVGSGVFLRANQKTDWFKKMPLAVRRMVGIKLDSSSSQSRFISWQAGLKGFQEKPLLGWGWENYNVVFNKHYQPWYLSRGYEATWFDRSHNQLIDVLSLTGVFGILSYLFIFISIAWLLFKRIKKENKIKEKIPFLIIGLMFFAYFIQNLFSFDTPAPLILLYFSFALAYFFFSQEDNVKDELLERKNQNNKKQKSFPLPVLILLILIFLSWGGYQFNIKPWQQSHLGFMAYHTAKKDLAQGLERYQQALAKDCFVNPEIRLYLLQDIAQNYAEIDETTNLETLGIGTEFAIIQEKKTIKEHPFDARHWLYLGQLYDLASQYHQPYLQDAEEKLLQAKEFSPLRQQVSFQLAQIYYYQQKYDQALDLLKEAVSWAPEIGLARNNLKKMITSIEKKEPENKTLLEAKEFLKNLNK